jgi:hypothetical protein
MISTANHAPVLNDALKSALKITVPIQPGKAVLTGRLRSNKNYRDSLLDTLPNKGFAFCAP